MLKRLLAEARRYHPSYRGGLCNHLPMALIALERMGATPSRLESYARAYLVAMEPAPEPGTAIDASNWQERLGEETAYPDFLGFFRREVARLNTRAALRAYLPKLSRGLAAAAFHPLIRTAFGVIADDGEEVSVGLAYWASRHLRLSKLGPAIVDAGDQPIAPTEDPTFLLAQLRGQPDLAFQPNPDNLIDRELAAAAALARYPQIARTLQVDDLTLDRLRRTAALLFLAADDFNSLHGVTALHAARVLVDFADNRRAFATDVWRALLALYLSLDRPALPDGQRVAALLEGQLPDWNEILPAAVASDDEHVIKLAYAGLSETRAGGGRLYRYLAARKAVLLVPATESRSEAPPAAADR
jgi:hypothetical protein